MLYRTLLIVMMFVFSSSLSHAKSLKRPTYSKYVKSMNQNKISSPVRKDKKKVYEGCGPIAAAMLLGYWQTQRGQSNLLMRGFNGTKHPSSAIRALYKEMKSKKAPGKKQLMSYTMPDSLYKALKNRVKNRKLKTDRKRKSSSWSKREAALKKQLYNSNPVILLKNKEHESGCLGKSSKGWNLIKNISNSHYFLAVGITGSNVQIMPGWSEKDKSASSSASVHKKGSSSHGLCTLAELKKANVSLFWIERK